MPIVLLSLCRWGLNGLWLRFRFKVESILIKIGALCFVLFGNEGPTVNLLFSHFHFLLVIFLNFFFSDMPTSLNIILVHCRQRPLYI